MKNNKLIFIGGLPRSGTTMVQNILDSHSEIYGGPEFDRIPNIIDLRNKLQKSLKTNRINAYTTKESIDQAIKSLIISLFSQINRTKDFNYISEKTPWNILFFPELMELFPQAKFIMVLRNPIDVFNSMKIVSQNAKAKGIKPPDFTLNYKLAVAYMESVYKLMDHLLAEHPNNLIMVRYESFIEDLRSEAERLCKFIGVPWEENLMNFNEIGHPGENTMTAGEIWYTSAQFKANPQEIKYQNKKVVLIKTEEIFIKYMFSKNEFINPKQYYFNDLKLWERVVGKIIYWDYKINYRFKGTPKRVLG